MIAAFLSAVLLRGRDLYWRIVYAGYRARYDIDPSFRFNGAGIQLYGPGSMKLEAGSYIGDLSTIQVASGQSVTVGRRCRISHNVRIYTSTAVADADFRDDVVPSLHGSIRIGDGAWIGTNVFIGPDVVIGENSVIGANSVVTRDIPAHEIWGGTPARLIRRKTLVMPGFDHA